MQYFMLIGGFVGFLLTLLASIVAGKDLADSVFNATIGCIVVAFLFRAFRYAAEYCAKQIIAEKARIREQELTASQSPNPEGTPSAESPGEAKPAL